MAAEFGVEFDAFPEGAPWLLLDDETDTAYAAFCVYRDEGPRRSLRQAARDYYRLQDLPERHGPDGGKLGQVTAWSGRNDWRSRAASYDHHLDRMRRIEHADEVKEMARRHAAVANVAIARGTERLRAMTAAELTPREAIVLIDLGVRIERLTRGQATEITAEDSRIIDVTAGQLSGVLASDPKVALAAREVALALASTVPPDPEAALPAEVSEAPEDPDLST